MTPALRAIAIAIALALLLIPPTAAGETIETIEISDYEIESINEEQTQYRKLTGTVRLLKSIRIRNIEQFTNPFSVIWGASPPRYASFTLSDKLIYADDSPVTYRYSSSTGPVIGTGRISYYKNVDGPGGDYVVLTFDTFHPEVIGTATGAKTIHLTDIKPDFNLYCFTFDDSNYPDDTFVSFYLTGYITTNLKEEFRQQIKYNTDNQQTSITVTRTLDHAYESRIIISGHNKSTPYTDTVHKTKSVAVTVPTSDAPFSIDIYSPTFDRWYNRTILQSASSGPDDTPGATIYVRSSQTGALLADAHLTILDGQTGATIVNQTLPTGTGSFNLEKAPTLRYHASATAEGYTLLSPILFGVGEEGTSITLWMSPDAPPDDPIEEGKSMLYGYIQTQGSQQPISGATVSLDSYGSTTTSSTGFYLFNNITPGTYTLSASAPLHDALSEPVTVDAAPTQHNLALKGHFLLTVTVKDGDTLANLQNATISLSDGQESTQNPATFNVDYGPYVITAAAGGYYPTTQTAYLDKPGTTTATVLLTAKAPAPTPPEMPNYPPHSVRFLCIDEYNHPIQNITIRAVYQESSSPLDWLAEWLGLTPNVQINNTTMEATTGLDGSVVFLMVQSVQYRVTVEAPAPLNMTKTFDLYPKEDEITIRFVTSARPDLSTMPTYDLTATETDPSSVQLALSYHDATNATTHLAFQVYDHATGDLIHTETFAASKFPGTVSPTYTVENTKGAMYRFGFEATNTIHGPISQYKGITLNGDGLLVDLGFEDRNLYAWLAVILMFLFAGAFSGTNVKQGAILVPLFGGGLFWYIGWLPITIGGVISAIGFLGVLVYMRKSEWKVRA